MTRYNACIIAESLMDPALINGLTVYRAFVSTPDRKIDEHGHTGRWHAYWVTCTAADIDTIQRLLKRGWYAHFWRATQILVVYSDRRFTILADDRSTWTDAVTYGRQQGIPSDELDFLTN